MTKVEEEGSVQFEGEDSEGAPITTVLGKAVKSL